MEFDSLIFNKPFNCLPGRFLELLHTGGLHDTAHAAVAWRLPDTEAVYFMTGTEIRDFYDFSFMDLPGFVLCPFRSGELPKKFIELKALFVIEAPGSSPQPLNEEALAVLEKLSGQSNSRPAPSFPPATPDELLNTEREDFITMAQSAVDKMAAGEFQKVVAARRHSVDNHKSVGVLLEAALDNYPRAFVYACLRPGAPGWMGATPEVLMSQNEEGIFRTTALAGTQPVPGSGEPDDASWTHKEIEEQAFVSRYIINCFKKIRLREYDEAGPATVRAGNLLHLKTDYKVDTAAVNFPDLGKVMAELLHPTSAVCGMPKEEALAFLKTHEQFDRSFFGGFVGPVNLAGRTDLYVNIRSAQLYKDKALLYAGAGLTARSVPRKEWDETGEKLKTMGKLFE